MYGNPTLPYAAGQADFPELPEALLAALGAALAAAGRMGGRAAAVDAALGADADCGACAPCPPASAACRPARQLERCTGLGRDVLRGGWLGCASGVSGQQALARHLRGDAASPAVQHRRPAGARRACAAHEPLRRGGREPVPAEWLEQAAADLAAKDGPRAGRAFALACLARLREARARRPDASRAQQACCQLNPTLTYTLILPRAAPSAVARAGVPARGGAAGAGRRAEGRAAACAAGGIAGCAAGRGGGGTAGGAGRAAAGGAGRARGAAARARRAAAAARRALRHARGAPPPARPCARPNPQLTPVCAAAQDRAAGCRMPGVPRSAVPCL